MDFERSEQFGRPVLLNETGLSFVLKENGQVSFGDVARNLLGQQCQYASRYIDPAFTEAGDYPNLGIGLRIDLGRRTGDYHDYTIHPDDIDTLVSRHTAYKALRDGKIYGDDGWRAITESEERELSALLTQAGIVF